MHSCKKSLTTVLIDKQSVFKSMSIVVASTLVVPLEMSRSEEEAVVLLG